MLYPYYVLNVSVQSQVDKKVTLMLTRLLCHGTLCLKAYVSYVRTPTLANANQLRVSDNVVAAVVCCCVAYLLVLPDEFFVSFTCINARYTLYQISATSKQFVNLYNKYENVSSANLTSCCWF